MLCMSSQSKKSGAVNRYFQNYLMVRTWKWNCDLPTACITKLHVVYYKTCSCCPLNVLKNRPVTFKPDFKIDHNRLFPLSTYMCTCMYVHVQNLGCCCSLNSHLELNVKPWQINLYSSGRISLLHTDYYYKIELDCTNCELFGSRKYPYLTRRIIGNSEGEEGS